MPTIAPLSGKGIACTISTLRAGVEPRRWHVPDHLAGVPLARPRPLLSAMSFVAGRLSGHSPELSRGSQWSTQRVRLTNTIMLSNVADITDVLASMAEDKHPVTLGACLSPTPASTSAGSGNTATGYGQPAQPLQPQPLPLELAL